MCFDRDRDDWRSLRLDRMAQVRVAGTTFTPREAPDAASYVRRAISSSPYPYVARVRYFAASDVVAQVFPTASVHIEADGPESFASTMRMISGGRIEPFPGEVFSESWALARAAEADTLGPEAPGPDAPLRFEEN